MMSQSWLRQASMKRLNTLVIDKKEVIGHKLSFCSNIDIENLEESGLSEAEKHHIRKWFTGDQSGRQCMLALLECDMLQNANKESVRGSTSVNLACGAPDRVTEFNILSKSINLPDNFLCDSGFICETIFSKPPNTVLKEALQILSKHALEKSSSALNVEQINIALKQMRMDNLKVHTDSEVDDKDSEENVSEDDENVETNLRKLGGKQSEEKATKYRAEMYRLQILLELLRLHISSSHGNTGSGGRNDEYLSTTGRRNTHVKQPQHPHHKDIEAHLIRPLSVLMKESEKLTSEDLDEANRLYQPYINQLMNLKASLKSQLQEIDDSRAFMSLGVSKNSSDSAIRKAYHTKAVRLHPDKPGGNKEKFQKLHDMYQDVLKRRREEAAVEEAAMRAVDTPESRQEIQMVRTIVAHIQECMVDIQRSAAECTQLAQSSVKWQKMIDAAEKLPRPRSLKKLHKMISIECDYNISVDLNSTGPVTVHNCAATLLLGPIDSISRAMHQVVTSVMQILKSGERYGKSASSDMEFMKKIEYAARCGMALQQCVPSLYPVENQILMCIDRTERSLDSAFEDEDIYYVLVRMICTVFATRAITLSSASDHAVTAAIAAADLILAVKSLLKTSDEEMLEKARRNASFHDKNMDFCAEDLAAMAEARQRDAMARRESEEKRQEEADKAQEEGREHEYMQTQIQSLQMQLRQQYIEALQTLNAETREMQKRIVAEVGSTVQEEINHKLPTSPPFEPPGESAAEDTIASGTGSHRKPSVASKGKVTLKSSLFSLLAEFVDSACTSLRNDLRESVAVGSVLGDSSSGASSSNCIDVDAMLDAHLGWMCSLGGATAVIKDAQLSVDESSCDAVGDSASSVMNDIPESSNACADEYESRDAKLPPSCSTQSKSIPESLSQQSVKLALHPDYRSKILWLSVMVDARDVMRLVQNELVHRLRRDCVTAVGGYVAAELVEYAMDMFCEEVLRGVEGAAREVDPDAVW